MVKFFQVILLFIITGALIACNDVEFDQQNAKSIESGLQVDGNEIDETPRTNPNDKDDPVSKTKLESFQSTVEKAKPIDMVWVIDNSGSMKGEAALVRNNLNSFIEYVEDRADLKMAVISREGNKNADVELPAGLNPDKFMQINQKVESHDSLVRLLSELNNNTLNSFLRKDSEKAFVFVTDDNAKVIMASHFMNGFKNLYPDQNFVAHGFIGLSKQTSPCQDKTGTEYKILSAETGGEVFNICEKNWSNHFDDLAEVVVAQAQSVFELDKSKTVLGIETVSINGQILDSASYELNKNKLSLDPKVLVGLNSYDIEVKYSYK